MVVSPIRKSESLSQAVFPHIVVLNSAVEQMGQRHIEHLMSFLTKRPQEKDCSILRDIAYTLFSRRTMSPWKSAVVATSSNELLEKLRDSPKFQKAPESPRLAFVFTGQGAQWYGMGRQLISRYPVFTASLARADKHLRAFGASWSILGELRMHFRYATILIGPRGAAERSKGIAGL